MNHELVNINPEAGGAARQEFSSRDLGRFVKVRRFIAAISLAASSSAFGVLASPSIASADDGGYPWTGATELTPYYSYGYETCPKTDSGCKDYPKMNDTVNGVYYGEADPLGYELRNCTSYVAWKEMSKGVSSSKLTSLGNGGQWYDSAPESEQSKTPKAWDAAVNPNISSYGHVAFVEKVNSVDPDDSGNDTITVSEYNYTNSGAYDTRTGTASSLGFTEYVDFGVHPTGNITSGGKAPMLSDFDNNKTDDVAIRVGTTIDVDTHHNGGNAEISFTVGRSTDEIYEADFNGDGKTEVVLRRGNMFYFINQEGVVYKSFSFGRATDKVIIGDWDGNGTDDIGLRRGNQMLEDIGDNGGAAEESFYYGKTTDQVYAGKFYGGRRDVIALRRDNQFFIQAPNYTGSVGKTFSFGLSTDKVIPGDWNGDGVTDIGLRRGNQDFYDTGDNGGAAESADSFGEASDQIIAGDFSGSGSDSLAAIRGNMEYFERGQDGGAAFASYSFGPVGAQIITRNSTF